MAFGNDFTFGRSSFGSGLRKVIRKDPIKMNLLRTPPELVGAVYFFGKIRSGKTTSMLSFAQLYHDNPNRKFKIIDLWGGSRNEHLYWGLPSNQTKYWNYVEKKFRLNEKGPKQYKVTYYYPLTKKLRKELPFKPGFVTSKVFTLDVSDLIAQDFALINGTIPDKTNAYWKEAIEETKRTDTIEDIAENFKKKVRKDDTLYNTVIKPLVKEGTIQKKGFELNLTTKQISKELDDRENVAVLCLDFVEKEFQLLYMGYFLRKICDELDRKRRKTICIMRETSEFFRVNDASIVPDRMKVFKAYLSDWIRMGRRGLHLFLDTQSPCLDENTKIVYDEEGKILTKKIKDLPEKFEVPSYNFKEDKIETKKAEKWYVGEKDVYEIELEDGEKVRATENHRFFNEKGKEVFVRDLKRGDEIKTIGNKKFPSGDLRDKVGKRISK